MIQNISVNRLEPHPDNPRRELGDLSELAASIRKSGLLQNLTVVPSPDDPDKYRVIIGHRRFAAAKIAGLTELPCAIEAMDAAEQMATMLAENMQRSDLTISDQVYGVQMMLNLGQSCKDITERTGLSETTVRKRAKLATLNCGKLAEAERRGATLMDFMEIAKIEDARDREYLMEQAGTNNFRYSLLQAQNKAERRARYREVTAWLDTFATALDSLKSYTGDAELTRAERIWLTDDQFKPPESVRTQFKQVWYVLTDPAESAYVDIYVSADEMPKKEQKPDFQREREALERRRAKQQEIETQMKQLRDDFIYHEYRAKSEDAAAIVEMALRAIGNNVLYTAEEARKEIRDALGMEASREKIAMQELEPSIAVPNPLRALLIAVYATMYPKKCGNWQARYEPNDDLDGLYMTLEKLGYQMSDAERAYLDGTHECWKDEG